MRRYALPPLLGLLLLAPLPSPAAPTKEVPDPQAPAAGRGQLKDPTGAKVPDAGSGNSTPADQPEARRTFDSKPTDKPGAKADAAGLVAAVPSPPQVVTPADAKAATDAATAYLNAMKERGVAAATAYLHTDAMARFKALVMPGLKDDQARGTRTLLNATFGREANHGVAAAAAPADFFSRFARLIAAREPDAAPRFSGLTPIGVVREAEQLHVLIRLNQSGGGGDSAGLGAVERVEVVSLLPQGSEWKVVLDGRLQELAYTLGRRAGADDRRAMPTRMEPVPEGLPLIQSEPAGPAGMRAPLPVPPTPPIGSGAVSPPYVMPDAQPQSPPRVRTPTD
ncbi:MAG TPA: hypothetical protein VES73_15350 [Lamprocystis sp. (in: g-proteobacteria)]|nr:hypothetical protein [Lamprocystis sp. (in: g-proteobacteria)]